MPSKIKGEVSTIIGAVAMYLILMAQILSVIICKDLSLFVCKENMVKLSWFQASAVNKKIKS